MVPEKVILSLVQDNIDVACAAIEKAAMDRAVADVDDGFAAAYEARRRHREVILFHLECLYMLTPYFKLRSGQSFWDPSAPQSAFIAGLPDPLRVKTNGLQTLQSRTYEDFGKEYVPFLVHIINNRYRVRQQTPLS